MTTFQVRIFQLPNLYLLFQFYIIFSSLPIQSCISSDVLISFWTTSTRQDSESINPTSLELKCIPRLGGIICLHFLDHQNQLTISSKICLPLCPQEQTLLKNNFSHTLLSHHIMIKYSDLSVEVENETHQ